MAAALHVSNGDATDLPGTGLASRVLYWRDVLHEGPVPAVGPEQLRRIRAEFLVHAGADDRGEGSDMFAERDRTLEAARDGEYVLWFEADLYDQLQIIQILARLTELGVPAERITLICIGEHAGIARFGGGRVLAAVADGAADAGTAFVRAAARETRPYLGDTWCYAMMDRMVRARVPLLHAASSDRPVERGTPLRLTDTGARVLAGDADHVTLNGIDRWIGGVHLHGPDARWRWDDGTETLVRAAEGTC